MLPFSTLITSSLSVLGAHRAVGADVADRGDVELQRPEAPGEGDLLLAGQMLAGEDQQGVVEPGAVERGEGRLVELGELQAGDDRAEAGVQRFDVEVVGHVFGSGLLPGGSDHKPDRTRAD